MKATIRQKFLLSHENDLSSNFAGGAKLPTFPVSKEAMILVAREE